MIDLRSDTVTRPTPAMREAIARAEVGDDCFGEDPTVRRLEERVAELLGKERALYFPSGIMANQAGLLSLGAPGTEVLLEARAHLLHYEEGSIAAHGGMTPRPIPSADGLLTPEELAGALRPPSRFHPEIRILALENTHLDSGGRVMDPAAMRRLTDLARTAGLRVHLDGARLWNAAVAADCDPADLADPADTVMTCLSKGLGAPVGSMLAADADTMERAWRIRRRLGGQMRQAGILAAAGLHALEGYRERMARDHERARDLAQGASGVPGLRVTEPESNIVMMDIEETGATPPDLLAELAAEGVGMVPFGPTRIRAVLHREIDDEDVRRAVRVLRSVVDRRASLAESSEAPRPR